MFNSKQKVDEDIKEAIKTHYIRHGGVSNVETAENGSGTSTFTRHVTLTFVDGRIEHHKILIQASHVTKDVKILSTRPYEPITPEKVLDGTVEVPPVGRISDNKKRNSRSSEQEIERKLENLMDYFA